ncbi:MAG: branched-chain amino acid ABC transporter permease [Blautia sp.]|nr:branched-chain amino acid ABC transporter permease [Blautia sp.]
MERLQLLINGLLLGGVYALLGVGMTIILGIMGLTNLFHGEFVILGAYVSTMMSQKLGVNPFLTLLVSVPFLFLLGALLQWGLIGRLMERGGEPALLVTFGISIILQDAMLLLFRADPRHLSVRYETYALHLGGLDISLLNVVLFGVSVLCTGLLWLFLNKTYAGRAIRATSDDRAAAMLSGVNVKRICILAMGVAMAMASVAGLCVGVRWTFYPSSGREYLLIAFIVVVIGGMGSIGGTLLAGLLFGVIQVMGGANYGLLISYALLLLVLVVRPRGLMGR